MNIAEFSIKISKFAEAVIVERDKHLLSLGFDAVAMVSKRVQKSGIKADGQKFKVPYSQKDLPAFFFPDKFVKYAKRNKIDKSYENYRKFIGLPIDKRTLTLTGGMFASVAPSIEVSTPTQGVCIIKSNNRDKQELLNINSEREKTNILLLAKDEKDFLNQRTRTWYKNLKEDNNL